MQLLTTFLIGLGVVSHVNCKCTIQESKLRGYQDKKFDGVTWYNFLIKPGFIFQNTSLNCATLRPRRDPLDSRKWKFEISFIVEQNQEVTMTLDGYETIPDSGIITYKGYVGDHRELVSFTGVTICEDIAGNDALFAMHACVPGRDEPSLMLAFNSRVSYQTLTLTQEHILMKCLMRNKIDLSSLTFWDNTHCPTMVGAPETVAVPEGNTYLPTDAGVAMELGLATDAPVTSNIGETLDAGIVTATTTRARRAGLVH